MAEIVICPVCGAKNRISIQMHGVPLCGRCKNPLPVSAPDKVRALDGESFEFALRLNPLPMLVVFGAGWSQPSQHMAAVLEKLTANRPEITTAKVDIEADPGLASQYQIFSVPTLVLFVKGREVHRVSGEMDDARLDAEFGPWLVEKQGP